MTLKFNLTYWQVPRSSVGRASDRTMLRSVVRVQSLTRGNLSFLSSFFFPFFFFFHFSHHIFLLPDNTSVTSIFVDKHIIYHQIDYILLLKMTNWGGTPEQKLPMYWNRKVILNWNRKSKWTEFPLTNWIICKPLQRRFFSSYQIAHMFLGLIFAVRSAPKTWL